jgi:hypothetical protein
MNARPGFFQAVMSEDRREPSLKSNNSILLNAGGGHPIEAVE